MKELFLIKDTKANQVSYYHLMMLLLSLPFDLFYSHIILISLSLHTIIHFNKNSIKTVFMWRTVALQAVFFVTLISSIYTISPAGASTQLGLDIPIFLFPLIFCFNPLDLKKYLPNLLLVFALGCTVTIAYLYIDAFATARYYKLPLLSIFSPAFTNQNFSEPIDMHATFFSLQVAISLVYLLSRLVNERSSRNKIFYAICCMILAAGIIQLSSKSVFVALFLTINIGFPYFLLEGARRKQFMLIASSLSVLIVAVILNSHAFRERFLTELKQDFSKTIVVQSVEPRLMRWEIAVDLVKKSPIVGYGAGSETGLLQDKYFAQKLYNSYLHKLNAHNEYLSFLIKSGIWGLLVYLATLIYGFRMAIRKKDIFFLTFMMLISIVSLSENILDVDKGVMFYGFFFSFFVFVSTQKEKLEIQLGKHKYLRKVATNHEFAPSSL